MSVMRWKQIYSGIRNLTVRTTPTPRANELTIIGRLNQKAALELLDAMAEEGAVEWDGTSKSTAIVYWRNPEEWANAIYEWIDSTGQKGSVLTLYEISEGDLTVSQGLSLACFFIYFLLHGDGGLMEWGTEFHGIDPYILRKALDVLVKRGNAQIFGANEDERGVKFF